MMRAARNSSFPLVTCHQWRIEGDDTEFSSDVVCPTLCPKFDADLTPLSENHNV